MPEALDSSGHGPGRARQIALRPPASSALRPLVRPAVECGLLSALAVLLVLHYGGRGFMPLDQSIVYDGGWRTLHGQVPYRDYVSPFGVPSYLIQGAFFAVFGVSWLAYCLHAAVVNALFALVALWLLRTLGVPRGIALAAAALSAVVYYPPMGTGYPDQDSFFFVLLAVAFAVAAGQTRRPSLAAGLWACIPSLVLVAALCKLIPGVFAVPLVLAVVAAGRPGTAPRALVRLAAGTAACLALAAGLAAVTGMHLGLLRLGLIDLPTAVGGDRSSRFLTWRYDRSWELITPRLPYPGFALAAVLAWRAGLLRRGSNELLALLVGGGLFVTGMVFATVTQNNAENSFAFLFVSLGLLTGLVLAWTRRAAVARWPVVAAGLLLAVICARDAAVFDRKVNGGRTVADLTFREPTAAEQRALPPSLRFLRWSVPPRYQVTPAQLSAVSTYLRAQPGNFVLVGDTTLLYSLADRPSTFPAMFLDDAEGYPVAGAAGYARFTGLLEHNLRRWRVRRVVVEAQPSWMGSTLADFPPVERLLRGPTCGTRTFGSFAVHELCRPA